LELIYTRAYTELEGITNTMGTQMSRILATGLAQGQSPTTIGRALSANIAGLEASRANMIARTEIIYAHAEGQLDAFEDLGIKETSAEVEWSTANDGKVCEDCDDMEGQVFTIEEARGQIPLHTNCRCCWQPVA
jgi:SPP1 gp7 family putative phage head morphogenesis protein